jgi:hypothetical protein
MNPTETITRARAGRGPYVLAVPAEWVGIVDDYINDPAGHRPRTDNGAAPS